MTTQPPFGKVRIRQTNGSQSSTLQLANGTTVQAEDDGSFIVPPAVAAQLRPAGFEVDHSDQRA
jgi:hypothetical protein